MSLSRNDKFMEAFATYFHNSNLMEKFYYPIEYNIECLTKNKNKNRHMYKIIFPKKVKLYERDITGTTPEIFYRNQDLPTIRELELDFDNYFSSYRLLKNLVLMSFIQLDNFNLTEEGLICFINVYYYKNHLPFPSDKLSVNILYFNSKLNAKEEEIDNLNDKLEESYNKKIFQKRKFAKLEREYNEKIRNMEKKIRQVYSEKTEKEECPVCYECLDTNEMIIPDCLHNICKTCCYKCDDCPLCRVQYSAVIKSLVIVDENDINNLLYSSF